MRVSNARIKQMANNLIHSCQGQTKEEEMLSTKTHKQGVRITYTCTWGRTVYQSSTVKEHDRAPERLKVKAEVFSLLTTYQANISEVYHLLNVCHCLVNFFYTKRLIWIMTVCTALYWDNGLSFAAIKYSRYVSSGAQPFAIAGSFFNCFV